jgi:hypothetical protein
MKADKRFDLELEKKYDSGAKRFKIKHFDPTKFFSHSFIAGAANKFSAPRTLCTAVLIDMYVEIYPWSSKSAATFKCTFRYSFDSASRDYVDDSTEFSVTFGNKATSAFRLDGLFSKTIYYDEFTLKELLDTEVVQSCEWHNVIKCHEGRKYSERFGNIPYIKDTCNITEQYAVITHDYNLALDSITSVTLCPLSVSKYISYFTTKLKTQKTSAYSEEDLAVYYDYVKRILADKVNEEEQITDYSPVINVPSFEYFALQRKYAKAKSNIFVNVKELSKQLQLNLADNIKERYVADLYKLVDEEPAKPKKTTTKKTTKKVSNVSEQDQ